MPTLSVRRFALGLKFALACACIVVFVSAPKTSATAQAAGSEVIFLRGIFGVFSTGLNEMSNRIEKKGVSSTVYHHTRWRSAAKAISRARKRGGARKIVIVGHSLGANAAVRLAKLLQAANIKVDHLITLDPTIRQAIPKNVAHAVNYYLPQSAWGSDLFPSVSFRGQLTNIQLATTEDFGHFSMDTDAQLKSLIEASVLATLKMQPAKEIKHRHTLRVSN